MSDDRSGGDAGMDRKAEMPAVKTTIVGGRPPGSGKMIGSIPRGIEVLVKKASVDPEFRTILLARRAAAADEIGLVLEPAEAAMLDLVPPEQLQAIIANTKVEPSKVPAFLGKAAAVMLVALSATSMDCRVYSAGVRPPDSQPATTSAPANAPASESANVPMAGDTGDQRYAQEVAGLTTPVAGIMPASESAPASEPATQPTQSTEIRSTGVARFGHFVGPSTRPINWAGITTPRPETEPATQPTQPAGEPATRKTVDERYDPISAGMTITGIMPGSSSAPATEVSPQTGARAPQVVVFGLMAVPSSDPSTQPTQPSTKPVTRGVRPDRPISHGIRADIPKRASTQPSQPDVGSKIQGIRPDRPPSTQPTQPDTAATSQESPPDDTAAPQGAGGAGVRPE